MIDIAKFLNEGWVVTDLPNPLIIKDWVLRLNNYVQNMTGHDLDYLDKLPDDEFKEIHIAMSEWLWDKQFSLHMGNAMLPLLKELIGMNIMVQSRPYFRLARPNKPQDNIGYHRDTSYGQSAYELNVHIPFVDLDEASALRVISGSHRMTDGIFDVRESKEVPVEKGSIENRTGRPYAAKRLRVPYGMRTVPMCIKVGQVAFFSPALFHGQEINSGDKTRISIDWHGITSTRAPIKIRTDGAQGGYEKIASSPLEKQAEEYYSVSQKE